MPLNSNKKIITQILEIARWAPSGDNIQPWRFEITSETSLVIHIKEPNIVDIYDYAGLPTKISLGCLIENIRLAASLYSMSIQWCYQSLQNTKQLKVTLHPSDFTKKEPLCDFIALRSVNRKRYKNISLSCKQKSELEHAVGAEFSIHWFESNTNRWQLSRLIAASTHIRLGLPEAIKVHDHVIDWENNCSTDRIPVNAIGVSAITKLIMKWVMRTPKRAETFLGKVPGSTLIAQFEMDLLPGMQCGAHFMLIAKKPYPKNDPEMSVRCGIALQRFWLTASKVGLAMQPSIATLCFAYYGRNNVKFSQQTSGLSRARKLSLSFDEFCNSKKIDSDQVLFMGRIGSPLDQQLTSRSIRMSLKDLTITHQKM